MNERIWLRYAIFCTRKKLPVVPSHPITSSKNPSAQVTRTSRNAYRLLALAITASVATGTLLYTQHADASWPFAGAFAEGNDNGPVIHDTEIDLLQAAVNTDPNPAKGGADIAMTEGAALIANTGPGGSSYIEGRSAKGSITTYTVQEGDSLSEIASSFGVSMNTVLWANSITDAKLVKPGTELTILPITGVSYKVREGDSVAAIAKKFNGESDDILSYNGLAGTDDLTAGTVLIIPGGEIKAAPAKKAVAKAKKASGAAARLLPAVSGYFGNPVPGGVCTQKLHGYNGVDIGAPSGTPIYAAAAGTVIVAKSGGYNGGYGSYVVVKHDNGMQTLYAHMSSVATGGGAVEKGALLGYVGRTGKATGNHLHVEVRGGTNPFCR